MSFNKRVVTSGSMLKNLQHRRISDLIGNVIPEEEAALLSNGRLTCLVCRHRPIFDTISVLSVHRKGKKHILELSEYLSHKQSLDIRALRAAVQTYGPGQQSLSSASSPYSSCVRRAPRSQHPALARRGVLDVAVTTTQPDLPVTPSASSAVRHYLKSLSRKKSLEKAVESRRKNRTAGIEGAVSGTSQSHASIPRVERAVPGTSQSHSSIPRPVTQALQRPSEPLRCGWLQDRHGVWTKDPQAEFDSDEDSPPSPESRDVASTIDES